MRILIVDDVFTNRFLLSEILKELGYEFFLAKNGKEAVDELSENDYDLVFMDIEMPVMNGVEATKYIRNKISKPKCDVPVVALTAHNPKLFFDDYSDAGFSNLLTKPYSISKIKEVIDQFVIS